MSVQKLADVINESVSRDKFLQYSPEVCVPYVMHVMINAGVSVDLENLELS